MIMEVFVTLKAFPISCAPYVKIPLGIKLLYPAGMDFVGIA